MMQKGMERGLQNYKVLLEKAVFRDSLSI